MRKSSSVATTITGIPFKVALPEIEDLTPSAAEQKTWSTPSAA